MQNLKHYKLSCINCQGGDLRWLILARRRLVGTKESIVASLSIKKNYSCNSADVCRTCVTVGFEKLVPFNLEYCNSSKEIFGKIVIIMGDRAKCGKCQLSMLD